MITDSDLNAVKTFLCDQLLQLGLGGNVVARMRTISVAAAISGAGRNVHAVGIGRKMTEGKREGLKCVRVDVIQKLPLSLLSPRDVVPPEIDGVPTDIVESEAPFLLAAKKRASRTTSPARSRESGIASTSCTQNRRRRQRPIVAGISAGHRDITAGTLGCFCKSTHSSDDGSQLFALSNNHVFANVNQALVGDPLYQPGPADGGGVRTGQKITVA